MPEKLYEIRDPVHGFVLFNDLERDIINSPPFQRLKWIKQLAMSYEVYPGATHTRFEHSIGTMELASRVFDTLVRKAQGSLADRLGWRDHAEPRRQRQIVRLAALLHDVGHAPFSHAPEELLPERQEHEDFTEKIIQTTELRQIIEDQHYQYGIKVQDVIPIAIGPKNNRNFSDVETILTEIITGDLGVDRIDYLNRDAHHAGVAYGRFDYLRLIDTMTVQNIPDQGSVVLAVDDGGVHAAEGLILARYFMFHQVYFHDVRVIYDVHLQDFLEKWLPGAHFPDDVGKYLELNDNVIHAAVHDLAMRSGDLLHALSMRLTNRRHFRTVCELRARHLRDDPRAFEKLKDHVSVVFDPELVRFRESTKSPYSAVPGHLWAVENNRLQDMLQISDIFPLKNIYVGRVFADPSIRRDVKRVTEDFITKLERH